ncbi:MAG TPA: hypothetical protein VJG90_02645 [Candidatus Nanoarchaeia archaeon]|nr:hypothetical protein [Candidatus Nanoarchaeia archaeon]
MTLTVEPGYPRLHDELRRRVPPYVESPHLDYFCGKYPWGESFATEHQVVGFDPRLDTEVWRTIIHRKFSLIAAKLEAADCVKTLRGGYTFTTNRRMVEQQAPFRSASAFFKFNFQGTELFSDIRPLLSDIAPLVVVDYDMVGMTQEEFFARFRAQAEIAEIRMLGMDEAYQTYTHVGLENCVGIADDAGFATLEAERFLGQYFIWVGVKQ